MRERRIPRRSARLYEPVYDYHLAHVNTPDDAPDWARAMAEQVNGSFDKLNNVLVGSQDAVLATTRSD